MTVRTEVSVTGLREFRAGIGAIDPSRNPALFSGILRSVVLLIERTAKLEKIIGGGGGAGRQSRPHPTKLTSRSGIGRRSISTDLSELPRQARVGSDRGYMAVHESGGIVGIPAHTVREHTRSVAFGRRVAPFKVPSHRRDGHTATFPRRPWLEPAVDETIRKAPELALQVLQEQIDRATSLRVS